MAGSKISLTALSDWLHSLANYLEAGRTIVEALRSMSKRGRPGVAVLSRELLSDLDSGRDFGEAIAARRESLPPLVVAMGRVANETGNLPEVLKELERFFRFQIRLKREFLSRITWPVVQLVIAILVIALVIFVLGLIPAAPTPSGGRFDPLGLGLYGASGAMIWLGGWVIGLATLVGAYWFVRERMRQEEAVDRLTLRIPVLGPCLSCLALSRICFGLRLTMDTAISTYQAIPLSLAASSNGAFVGTSKDILDRVRHGEDLHDAFSAHAEVYPPEFLDAMATGEQTGTIPETMGRMGRQYEELALRRLETLNVAASWSVWLIVATIILYFVFRLFLNYLALLNEFLPE